MALRALAVVVLTAAVSSGCFWLVRDPMTGRPVPVGPLFVYQGARSSLPNLTFVPVGGGTSKIELAPCSGGRAIITPEDRVCARLGIENLGSEWTSGPVEVLILLDGTPIENWFIPDLVRPGEIAERADLSFGPLAPGLHILRAALDPAGQIRESSESDNDLTVPFRVSPAPR